MRWLVNKICKRWMIFKILSNHGLQGFSPFYLSFSRSCLLTHHLFIFFFLSFFPSFLPSFVGLFIPSLVPSFLPSFLPTFLPSFLYLFLSFFLSVIFYKKDFLPYFANYLQTFKVKFSKIIINLAWMISNGKILTLISYYHIV